jgi:hypothetical protein
MNTPTKTIGINGRKYATLAPAKLVQTNCERFKPHASAPITNAGMPNAEPGFAWPHLATPPRG